MPSGYLLMIPASMTGHTDAVPGGVLSAELTKPLQQPCDTGKICPVLQMRKLR